MQHWFATWLGLTGPDTAQYLFWSGVGGDLGYVAIIVLLADAARRHTCDVPRCSHLARYKVTDTDGDPHTVCRTHRPRTAEQRQALAERLAEVDSRPIVDG